MPTTRGRMRTRQQKRNRAASPCPEPKSRDAQMQKSGKQSTVSPRDITSCAFEKDSEEKQVKSELPSKGTALSKEEKRSGITNATVNSRNEGGKKSSKQTVKVGKVSDRKSDERDVSLNDKLLKDQKETKEAKEKGEELKTGTVKSTEDGSTATFARVDEKSTEEGSNCEKDEETATDVPTSDRPQTPQRDDTDSTPLVALEPPEGEENGASSCSSISKRGYRSRRISATHLRSTRALRRQVAKARAQRLKQELEEAAAEERVRRLDSMAADEREREVETMEAERREREAARRREVKRVKNRESVEKTRVRELVFEAKVGSEWEELKRENECMVRVLEWIKRENIVKQAKKEVAAVLRKRKRKRMKEV